MISHTPALSKVNTRLTHVWIRSQRPHHFAPLTRIAIRHSHSSVAPIPPSLLCLNHDVTATSQSRSIHGHLCLATGPRTPGRQPPQTALPVYHGSDLDRRSSLGEQAAETAPSAADLLPRPPLLRLHHHHL